MQVSRRQSGNEMYRGCMLISTRQISSARNSKSEREQDALRIRKWNPYFIVMDSIEDP